MRSPLARSLALVLVLAACSGGSDATTTTSTLPTSSTTSSAPSSTTAPPPVTTSTIAEDPVSALNGLPVEDESLLNRRVLAVKIDNHPRARPQSGINHADVVIEVMVEGITRFLTLWHQSDVEYLGPMRSGRPTDAAVLASLNHPTFSISGAQAWVQSLIRSKDVHLTGEVRPATFRIGGRSAPHNLYVNTNLLRQHADSLSYPNDPPEGPIWQFGPMRDDAVAASSVRLNFSGNIVEWEWDQATSLWLRTASGSQSNWRDKDGTTGRVGAPVMVALYVDQYTVFPPAGQSGKALPSSKTVGSGKAFVFANGQVIEGTWTRNSETEWFSLTDAKGGVIPVPPGQAWISLVPSNNGLSFQ